MFLTCLLNSGPPALKRNSFGILFHCFAAKYLKEFNPYFVVFTFGNNTAGNTAAIKSVLLFMAGLLIGFLVEKCVACQSR